MSELREMDPKRSAQPGEGEHAEPWEPWETKLVLYSLGIGIVVLVIGGLLINHFML
jgi:hypothetical protein